jgi:hypothetical protein
LRTPAGQRGHRRDLDAAGGAPEPRLAPARQDLARAAGRSGRGSTPTSASAPWFLGRELVEKELRKFRLSPRDVLDRENPESSSRSSGSRRWTTSSPPSATGRCTPRSLVALLLPDDRSSSRRPKGSSPVS